MAKLSPKTIQDGRDRLAAYGPTDLFFRWMKENFPKLNHRALRTTFEKIPPNDTERLFTLYDMIAQHYDTKGRAKAWATLIVAILWGIASLWVLMK